MSNWVYWLLPFFAADAMLGLLRLLWQATRWTRAWRTRRWKNAPPG